MRRVRDSRTRSISSLKSLTRDDRITSSNAILPLATIVLRVVALSLTKEWILARGLGSTWAVSRSLGILAVPIGIWLIAGARQLQIDRIDLSALLIPSLALLVGFWSVLASLSQLPVTIVLAFTHAATLWLPGFTSSASPRKTTYAALAFLLSILTSAYTLPGRNTGIEPSIRSVSPAYLCLVIAAGASLIHQKYVEPLAFELRSNVHALAITLIGATLVAAPLGFLDTLVRPTLLSDAQASSYLNVYIGLSLLAASFIFSPTYQSTPRGAHLSLLPELPIVLSVPLEFTVAAAFNYLAFGRWVGIVDLTVVGLLFTALSTPSPNENTVPVTAAQLRSYYQTIMANDESRKIAYFLALNLAFMGVQLMYGVWTNSLGLISDAIHMFFDCIAIAMGLLASIMATWPPNERFTYGYGRIETLSGFANGIFLILISVFIVFEAIKRILDPPEMSTKQLLLVSSLGLGVNLFGMFAMGGHHHHHHGHGHGHSHGHDHGHIHGHSHGHGHSHTHDHGHSHSHTRDHDHAPTHDHEHDHSHNHDREHEHDHRHRNHSHSHAHTDHAHVGVKISYHEPHEHGHRHQEEHRQDSHEANEHTHSETHSREVNGMLAHTHHSHHPESAVKGLQEHEHGSDVPASSHPHSHTHNHSSATPIAHHHDHRAHSDRDTHSLQVAEGLKSPLTPSYSFTQDRHLEEHHRQHHSDSHAHHDHAHSSHSHADSHSHEHGHSHNMRGVFLHVMADTLGSVGVIVSTLLIQFYGWTGFDPIASLFIAALIVASVVPLVIDCGRVLSLDLGGQEDDVRRALSELSHIKGVKGYAHPRFWPKDAESLVGSITILLARSTYDESQLQFPLADVTRDVDVLLRQKLPSLVDLAIQVE